MPSPYEMAQRGLVEIKCAVHEALGIAIPDGLDKQQLAQRLGITVHMAIEVLVVMEREGIVDRDDDTRAWKLKGGK